VSSGRANPPILVIDSGTRSADWLLDWARHRPTDAVPPLIVLEPGADVAETVRRVRRARGPAPLGMVVVDDANALIAIEAGADDAIPERRLDATSVLAFVDAVMLRARIRRERDQMRAVAVQSERLASLGMVVAGVAHEANNPLTSLLLSTDVFRLRLRRAAANGAAVDPELDEILNEIEASSHAVVRIVQDLKVFSRPGDDRGPEIVDLRAMIGQVLRIVGRQIRASATLELDYQMDLPTVMATPDQLAQVLTNVLLNAAQAVSEVAGRPHRIRVSTQYDDEAVAISVSDTGPGIPADVLSRIFDPFFTTKGTTGGTGLGLAISRDLMRRLGGDLLVESVHGQGATFIAIVPRPDAAELAAAAARRSRHPTPPESAASGRRVLAVDADEGVLRAVARALEPHYEVLLANDGQEASDLLASGSQVDAVVIDASAPAHSAAVLRDWLLQRGHPLATRMVALSSDEELRFEPPGPEPRVLRKPISRKALLEAIGRALAPGLTSG
jgi:signal transduction histidine kinase